MNLENIFQQILTIAGTFNFTLVVSLCLICLIGEIGVSIPYLLETVWLSSGYNLSHGALSFIELVLLWLAAQVGRQVGALMLFYISRFGSIPLLKLYRKYFRANLSEKLSGSNAMPLRLLRRIDYSSPFSLAIGRLFGMRIPLTLAIAVGRPFKRLAMGVLVSSIIWDGVYILLGMIGGYTVLTPAQMMLYSLIGLTILYAITFTVRRLLRR